MNKRLITLSVLLLSIIFISNKFNYGQQPGENKDQPKQEKILQSDTPQEEEHNEEGGHDNNMYPLLFIILALLIGAATRHFFRKSPLPYTVTLLLIGLILGALFRIGALNTWDLGFTQVNVSFLHESIKWAGLIDPHLILYIFLPTLIFEAAFAMDVHTFRKSFANAVTLALPGIIVALILTALVVMA